MTKIPSFNQGKIEGERIFCGGVAAAAVGAALVEMAAVHFVFSILFGCVSMLASMTVRFLENSRVFFNNH